MKPTATRYRRRGYSIRSIEQKLGIPRSTLSGWLKSIVLSKKQQQKLLKKWEDALTKARKKAVLWHNEQKHKRILEAQVSALKILERIDIKNPYSLELALAMLYLGEGSKRNVETAIGSSSPRILQFFLKAVQKLYYLDLKKIRCELYLRADQDPEKIKHFWSTTLKLPLSSFYQVNIDKRTTGSKTYPNYNGVCALRCGNVAIQRKLLSLSELFCERVINLGS